MWVITKKDICFYSVMVISFIMAVIFPIVSKKDYLVDVDSNSLQEKIIVIDAGHGEPDGGAVSKNGVKESLLNLQIAQKLADKLKENNFEIIMTREDEKNIASDSEQDKSIKQIKTSDLNNRVKIANTSEASILVSILFLLYASALSSASFCIAASIVFCI